MSLSPNVEKNKVHMGPYMKIFFCVLPEDYDLEFEKSFFFPMGSQGHKKESLLLTLFSCHFVLWFKTQMCHIFCLGYKCHFIT